MSGQLKPGLGIQPDGPHNGGIGRGCGCGDITIIDGAE